MCVRRAWVKGVMLGVLVACGLTAAVSAQEAPGRRRRWNPEEMRARYLERFKEQLEVSDAEWEVIRPRLEKVTALARETTISRFGQTERRRGRRGGDEAEAQEQSALAEAAEELREVLEADASTPEEIQAKLTALREAREQARQDLAQAQAELRELLTQRQEAQLVLLGILD